MKNYNETVTVATESEADKMRGQLDKLVAQRQNLNYEIRQLEDNIFFTESAEVLKAVRNLANKYKNRFTTPAQVRKLARVASMELRSILMENAQQIKYINKMEQMENRKAKKSYDY